MPNWCYNELKVTGSEKEVMRFAATSTGFDLTDLENLVNGSVGDMGDTIKQQVRAKLLGAVSGRFCINNTIPMPEELEDTQSPSLENDKDATRRKQKYGYSNWYDWRIANWGVKWDVSDVEVAVGSEAFNASFSTPWGPPETWVAALSTLFELSFELHFWEPDNDYHGVIHYETPDKVHYLECSCENTDHS